MSRHQIPRLAAIGRAVGRQFAFRWSLDGSVVDDGLLGGTGFVEGGIPFGGSSNGGFWAGKVKNDLSFNGD
jgi:hypothetical protein